MICGVIGFPEFTNDFQLTAQNHIDQSTPHVVRIIELLCLAASVGLQIVHAKLMLATPGLRATFLVFDIMLMVACTAFAIRYNSAILFGLGFCEDGDETSLCTNENWTGTVGVIFLCVLIAPFYYFAVNPIRDAVADDENNETHQLTRGNDENNV